MTRRRLHRIPRKGREPRLMPSNQCTGSTVATGRSVLAAASGGCGYTGPLPASVTIRACMRRRGRDGRMDGDDTTARAERRDRAGRDRAGRKDTDAGRGMLARRLLVAAAVTATMAACGGGDDDASPRLGGG